MNRPPTQRSGAELDGGGVLSRCAFFLVGGVSPPNQLCFNATTDTA